MKGFWWRLSILLPLALLICYILPQVVYLSEIIQILFGWVIGCGPVVVAAFWTWKVNK